MLTKLEIKQAIHEVLEEHRSLDEEQHSLHHAYIEAELRRREERHVMWLKFKSSFIGGLALGILGALGWLGTLILEALRNGGPHGP